MAFQASCRRRRILAANFRADQDSSTKTICPNSFSQCAAHVSHRILPSCGPTPDYAAPRSKTAVHRPEQARSRHMQSMTTHMSVHPVLCCQRFNSKVSGHAFVDNCGPHQSVDCFELRVAPIARLQSGVAAGVEPHLIRVFASCVLCKPLRRLVTQQVSAIRP